MLSQCIAQDYHPLIRQNTTWDVMRTHAPSHSACSVTSGDRRFFDGTTDTIQGIEYAVVKSFSIRSLYPTVARPFCPPYYVDTNQIHTNPWILLREDSVNRKVYVFDNFNNQEYLLYDFNLSPGDTLHSEYSDVLGPVIVNSIGYVVLKNGSIRKKYFLNNHHSYIESIGGQRGLGQPLYSGLWWWEDAKCVLENGSLLFDWVGNCQCLSASVDIGYWLGCEITAFPNPCTDYIIIWNEHETPIQIIIYDNQGKEVHSESFSSHKKKIDLRKYSSGIYYYVINNQKEIIKSDKFFLNN